MVKAARKPRAKKAPPVEAPPTEAELQQWGENIYFAEEILFPALLAGRAEASELLYYGLIDARAPVENPMFSPWSNDCTYFIRPADKRQKWKCGACGKAHRPGYFYWTQFVPFRAGTMWGFGISFSAVLPPNTPVCGDHLLSTWPQLSDEPVCQLQPEASDDDEEDADNE